jgi:hypothetical protein
MSEGENFQSLGSGQPVILSHSSIKKITKKEGNGFLGCIF